MQFEHDVSIDIVFIVNRWKKYWRSSPSRIMSLEIVAIDMQMASQVSAVTNKFLIRKESADVVIVIESLERKKTCLSSFQNL